MKLHTCDDLVIGSSPVSLFAAIALAKEGRHVLVAEGDTDIGGVWAPARTGQQTVADQAPHLIDARPGVYEFLSDELGLDLIDVTDDAYIAYANPLFGERLHPYTDYWLFGMCADENREVFRQLSDGGASPGLIKLEWESRRAAAGQPEDREPVIRYFKAGTGEFVRSLEAQLKLHDVEVLTGQRISTLEVGVPGTGFVGHSDGAAITAQSVVMNGHAFPDTIAHTDRSTDLEWTSSDAHSLIMTVDDNTADPFFYAVYPESELIHLAADLSYGEPIAPLRRTLVVTMDNRGLIQHHGGGHIPGLILQELQQSGLVAPRARLVSVDLHSVSRRSITPESRDHAKQFDGVRFLESRGGLDRSLVLLSEFVSEKPQASQPEQATHIL